MSSVKLTVGVAGCGSMGLPMAISMHKAGHTTLGFDIRPSHEFGEFQSQMIADPAEFAARCDVVISVVRDINQSLALLFDQQGLFAGRKYLRILLISSTLSSAHLDTIA